MTRISLRETYDNRSVIAQIAKVTDTAEDAAETVQQKAAEINDALTDVNAAVQAAEGAVTTANAASASAQQSAQTVAGYENRLGAVEGDVVQLNTDVDGVESDLNAVTLRVQTAEGNIVTIEGRVTALETADGQNVKINRINEYAVGLTGNQTIYGTKNFDSVGNGRFYQTASIPYTTSNQWYELMRFTNSSFVDFDYVVAQRDFGVDNLFVGKVNIQLGISSTYPNKSKIAYKAETVPGAIASIDLTSNLILAKDSEGVYHVFLNHQGFRYGRIYVNYANNLNQITNTDVNLSVTAVSQPSSGDYTLFINGSVMS